jgi:hypothetical protein
MGPGFRLDDDGVPIHMSSSLFSVITRESG